MAIKDKINMRGDAPWWAFLAAVIIAIVVVIFYLVFFGKVKIGGEAATTGIIDKIGQMFK